MINTQTATLSELKAFVADNDIFVEGDRRRKASFIEAIDAWYHETSYYENDISIDDLTNLPIDGEFVDISIQELDNARQYVSNNNSYNYSYSNNELDTVSQSVSNVDDDEIVSGMSELNSTSVPIDDSGSWMPMVITLPLVLPVVCILAVVASVARCMPFVIQWLDSGLQHILEGLVEFTAWLFGDEYDDEIDSHYLQVKELFSS